MSKDLELADWRARVLALYRSPTVAEFRRGRDALFRNHSQTPVPADDRATFAGIDWFPEDETFRVTATLHPADSSDVISIETAGDDGTIRYRRSGRLKFELQGQACELTLFKQLGYGGGLFLPFRDRNCGSQVYGGGRYLVDHVKMTFGRNFEFQPDSTTVTLDFNYAYNPSCAYNPDWSCPLSPAENRLSVAVNAGERAYKGHGHS